MKKWVCTVCGYVYEGENPPEKCPQCGVPASKFKEQAADETSWACEHEVGVAQGSPEDIMADLRANFDASKKERTARIRGRIQQHLQKFVEISGKL